MHTAAGLALARASKPKLAHVDFDAVAGLVPADGTAARVASSGKHQEGCLSRELAANLNANNRKPVYHDHSLRIVSRPNGLWRVEHRVAEQGSRERDSWEPVSRDTTKEAAMQKMLSAAGAAL